MLHRGRRDIGHRRIQQFIGRHQLAGELLLNKFIHLRLHALDLHGIYHSLSLSSQAAGASDQELIANQSQNRYNEKDGNQVNDIELAKNLPFLINHAHRVPPLLDHSFKPLYNNILHYILQVFFRRISHESTPFNQRRGYRRRQNPCPYPPGRAYAADSGKNGLFYRRALYPGGPGTGH